MPNGSNTDIDNAKKDTGRQTESSSPSMEIRR